MSGDVGDPTLMSHVIFDDMLLQGNVENWLGELLNLTRRSLHSIIRSAAIAITDPGFKLLEFENMFPSQVSGSKHAVINDE